MTTALFLAAFFSVALFAFLPFVAFRVMARAVTTMRPAQSPVSGWYEPVPVVVSCLPRAA
jgi:hypothetical protein